MVKLLILDQTQTLIGNDIAKYHVIQPFHTDSRDLPLLRLLVLDARGPKIDTTTERRYFASLFFATVVSHLRATYNGVVVLGEASRVLGADPFYHVLHPISVSTLKSSNGEEEMLAWWMKARKRKRQSRCCIIAPFGAH